jgi:predicted nuclease of predicted toxin-antitoxin system
LRFLIDENLPLSISEFLASDGHDVVSAARSKLRGAPDSVIWSVSAGEQRLLVTRDLDFPITGKKPAPYGVMLLRVPFDFTARQILGTFKGAWGKVKSEDLKNKVVVISPGRVRLSQLP